MTGLGGAELRLPFLVGVLGLASKVAVPINLAVSLATVVAALTVRVPATGLQALLPWLPIMGTLIVGGVVTAYFGAGWLRRVSVPALERSIAVLLVLLGMVMIAEAALPLAPSGLLSAASAVGVASGLGFGAVIGAISSLLGVAGGEVIIPTLVVGYGVPIALAGTLSLLISLPTILVGLTRHIQDGAFVDRALLVSVVVPMAFGAIIGSPIGAALAPFVPGAIIKGALGILLIWSSWKVFGHRQISN